MAVSYEETVATTANDDDHDAYSLFLDSESAGSAQTFVHQGAYSEASIENHTGPIPSFDRLAYSSQRCGADMELDAIEERRRNDDEREPTQQRKQHQVQAQQQQLHAHKQLHVANPTRTPLGTSSWHLLSWTNHARTKVSPNGAARSNSIASTTASTDSAMSAQAPSATQPAAAAGKNKGRWSDEEHGAFLRGLHAHGRDWKSIASLVRTRSHVQIRTHAQKFFLKARKEPAAPQPAGEAPPKRRRMSTASSTSRVSTMSASSASTSAAITPLPGLMHAESPARAPRYPQMAAQQPRHGTFVREPYPRAMLFAEAAAPADAGLSEQTSLEGDAVMAALLSPDEAPQQVDWLSAAAAPVPRADGDCEMSTYGTDRCGVDVDDLLQIPEPVGF